VAFEIGGGVGAVGDDNGVAPMTGIRDGAKGPGRHLDSHNATMHGENMANPRGLLAFTLSLGKGPRWVQPAAASSGSASSVVVSLREPSPARSMHL